MTSRVVFKKTKDNNMLYYFSFETVFISHSFQTEKMQVYFYLCTLYKLSPRPPLSKTPTREGRKQLGWVEVTGQLKGGSLKLVVTVVLLV